MKATTFVLMAACCLPLMMACGDRSTHRSADRSQRLVIGDSIAISDKQALTEQDVAVSRTRRGSKTQSVGASSYKETPARSSKAVKKPKMTRAEKAKKAAAAKVKPVTKKVEEQAKPANRNVVQEIVISDTKPVEVKVAETKPAEVKVAEKQPADKPLAQKPVQEKPTVAQPTSAAVASGPEKVLVEGCVLKQPGVLGAFSVVAGSFSQPESAVSLIKKLDGMGIKPFFVLNEKGMYRLITGTFNDRDEADYQVLKLDVEAIKAWVFIR